MPCPDFTGCLRGHRARTLAKGLLIDATSWTGGVSPSSGVGRPGQESQIQGGEAGVTPAQSCGSPGKRNAGPLRTYEITFTGRAGDTLCAAFDDCTVTLGPGTTTLRAELPDQAALWGLVQRITGLGLEVVGLHLLAPD